MTDENATTTIDDEARQMTCTTRVLPVDPDLVSSKPGSGNETSSAASTYRLPVGWDPAFIETSSTKRAKGTKRHLFTPRGIRKWPEYNYEFMPLRINSGHVAPAKALKDFARAKALEDLPRRPFNPDTEPRGQYQVPYQPWSPGYSTAGGVERPIGDLGIPCRTAEGEAEDSSLKSEPLQSAGETETNASAEKEGESTTAKEKKTPAIASPTVEGGKTPLTSTSNPGDDFSREQKEEEEEEEEEEEK